MAAATQTNKGVSSAVPFLIHKIQLSALTSGQTENLDYSTPVAKSDPIATPFHVSFVVLTPPATGEQVSWCRVQASDVAASSTIAVKVVGEAGGDLTGCVVEFTLWFLDQARQDGQSISQDNNT